MSQTMNRKYHKTYFLLFLWMAIWILSCSDSPFGEEIKENSSETVEGIVKLSENENPGGVYIWLEDTQLNTFTDGNGEFKLILPQSNSLENGIFRLFYYVANYKLSSSSLVVNKGKFILSRGDLDNKGKLVGTKSLVKLLRIKTDVNPDTVDRNYEGPIQVLVTLQAMQDSVQVVLPKSIEGSRSAIIFSRDGQVNPIVLNNNNSFVLSNHKIGNEEEILKYGFTLSSGLLPNGTYQIIPYFLIIQDELPVELIASIDSAAETFGPNFLKIPFKREGGMFVIIQEL
ncbi:hypothetical protein IIC38_04700 [candidate division KSB1 bacterium]|nr:hypothetical protein [candidate division KSB1 bacterium]